LIGGTVYRVNWLRASARSQRWDEEVILLQYEMKWTVKYFEFHKIKWETWAEEREMDMDGSLFNKGLRSYAYKQAKIWARLESRAREVFESSAGNKLY
jgi:hypothetical protein